MLSSQGTEIFLLSSSRPVGMITHRRYTICSPVPIMTFPTEIMTRYHEDCVAGIHNQHHQDIKNEYYGRCKTFWTDIQRKYTDDALDTRKLNADAQEKFLLRKLNIIFRELAAIRQEQAINDAIMYSPTSEATLALYALPQFTLNPIE